MPNLCVCGVILDDSEPQDVNGCILPLGHAEPHEFVTRDGEHWQWETDFDCSCEHCMRGEGDYCTNYWCKPTSETEDGSTASKVQKTDTARFGIAWPEGARGRE